ncbi:ATP synthase F0 subunit B [Streptomyces sp. NBC_01304]|uniref:ATP synthase F0 subunit B n=1 Tax=Streptomyces sp. NBC_01304 TaxID=2903818 RepID=UPI002E1026FB|nr:cell division initiation protein [Streptomyces sp. NBC_01304]
MDVQKKLDEIVEAVMGARSMPMSASCVVNRTDLLSMLEDVRGALPGSLAQAQELIGGREQMVEQARLEADRIIETARAERGSLISDTAVARQSQDEAERILAKARQEAEEIQQEADVYVDSKLANFEVVLTKTLGSVGRGREKLLGTGEGLDAQGYEDPDFTEAPERSQDPETLRRRADEYVDGKLGAFEAVLSKTLDAVGRGRQKLQGRVATDDLGQLGEGTSQGYGSDADFLADLADPQAAQITPEQDPPQQAPAGVPAQPQYAQQDPYAYQQQDTYGYQQQSYAGHQDQQPYGTQQDPYAAYGQQDQYGYPQQQGYDQSGGYAETHGGQQPQHDPSVLDETSLFDTSMISVDQLRQYEQGRGQGQN